MNIYAILVSALVPLLVGFLWYNEKTMGASWIKETGLSKEFLEQGNMPKIFGFTLLFSLLLATLLAQGVIHQNGVSSLLMHHPDEAAIILEKYKMEFRTFGHGAFHGILWALFGALPILGINSLFERKSWKYIFIHLGYWMITMALMGGILSAWI